MCIRVTGRFSFVNASNITMHGRFSGKGLFLSLAITCHSVGCFEKTPVSNQLSEVAKTFFLDKKALRALLHCLWCAVCKCAWGMCMLFATLDALDTVVENRLKRGLTSLIRQSIEWVHSPIIFLFLSKLTNCICQAIDRTRCIC